MEREHVPFFGRALRLLCSGDPDPEHFMTQLLRVCLILFSFACTAWPAEPATQPWNVVLILIDDLGWTDLGCYGSRFYETPHIDRLASEGMRFTQNYSACTVCSPTRAALMTGKYPARLHLTDWSPGQMPDNPKQLAPDWQKHLPLEEVTLAELFQAAGYATASIGKWHLGTQEFYPEHQGFGLNIAGTDKAAPPSFIAPWRIPNLEEGRDGEYLTDRLGQLAAEYVGEMHDRAFFLYLPHFAVHTPIQGRKDLVEKYRMKPSAGLSHNHIQYAAMVESMDASVGAVLQELAERGIADRTIVLLTSDNGGLITRGTTSNAPLRFGKASAYEGGVRVPLIVRWPGVTMPGSICDEPVITMDLFATLVDACGLNVPSESESTSSTGPSGRDGVSLMPLLSGKGTIERESMYWHYPHHQHYQLGGAMPYSAIRRGDFKLIEFLDDGHVELFDLREDIGEQMDLAAAKPDVVSELKAYLTSWRDSVGAQLPLPNPNYDPARPQYDSKRPQPKSGERPRSME